MVRAIAHAAPSVRARICGAFYALTFALGSFAVFGSGTLSDVAGVVAGVSYIFVTLLFYGLFVPVNRNLSLLAACVSIAGIAIGILSAAGVFKVKGVDLGLVLFGCYDLMIGYLIFRSNFLPRWLGLLMALGGLGWLTFLSVPLAHRLSPYVFFPGMLGEGALTIWLLAMGVDDRRWTEQAASR